MQKSKLISSFLFLFLINNLFADKKLASPLISLTFLWFERDFIPEVSFETISFFQLFIF